MQIQRTALAIILVATGAAACSEEQVACAPDETLYVSLESPVGGGELGVGDDTSAAPGLQVDIAAVSNAETGEQASLFIVTELGTHCAWPEPALVDVRGNIVFEDVTLPEGVIEIGVETRAGCTPLSDTAELSVNFPTSCHLSFASGTASSVRDDSFRVLDAALDADPDQPGYQGSISVVTAAGYGIDLYELNLETGVEHELTSLQADDAGLATAPVTLDDGLRAIRAVCSSEHGGTRGASATQAVFVDVTVPACELLAPAQGAVIGPELDVDARLEGTQVLMWARVVDDGIEGAPTLFTVDSAMGTLLVRSEVDGDGYTGAMATFVAPGQATMRFEVTDGAGNRCAASGSISYVR